MLLCVLLLSSLTLQNFPSPFSDLTSNIHTHFQTFRPKLLKNHLLGASHTYTTPLSPGFQPYLRTHSSVLRFRCFQRNQVRPAKWKGTLKQNHLIVNCEATKKRASAATLIKQRPPANCLPSPPKKEVSKFYSSNIKGVQKDVFHAFYSKSGKSELKEN